MHSPPVGVGVIVESVQVKQPEAEHVAHSAEQATHADVAVE